jgi:hypothetical protein
MGLLCLVRAYCFSSSVVTLWGYKSRRSPLHTPASSHIFTIPTSPLSLRLKRKIEKEKKMGLPGFRECCFSFLLMPWAEPRINFS